MKELSTEKAKAYDGNYKAYIELINRLEDVKDAIKKQNYGIAMDILCKPYPEFQITTSTELAESEDERIRQFLIHEVTETSDEIMSYRNMNKKDVLDWLEKQGETFTKKDVDGAYLKGVCDTKYELKKQGEQKPTDIQSIEKRAHEVFPDDNDENTPFYRQAFIDGAVDYIDCGCKNTAWSKEDEEMYKEVLTDIIYAKNDLEAKECLGLSKRAMNAFNWFGNRCKSLIPQNTWKPSDEQMKALEHAINCYSGISPTNTEEVYTLEIMKEKLNKLREK